LLALAWHLDGLIHGGVVANQAELARLGHVSRARMSQILSLLNLTPEIQETVLFLAPVVRGRDAILLRHLLPLAARPGWTEQRRLWHALVGQLGPEPLDGCA
jgi:hypothetical protein